MPTTITHTVKPAGGGDYTSINAWNTAQKRDLTTADEIAQASCYTGNCVSTNLEFNGTDWTTSATQYVDITVASGERWSGSWTTSKAYCQTSASTYVLAVRDIDFHISHMQLDTDTTSTGRVFYGFLGAQIQADNCFFRVASSANTNRVFCFEIISTDTVATITNSVLLNNRTNTAAQQGCLYVTSGTDIHANIYNSICVTTGTAGAQTNSALRVAGGSSTSRPYITSQNNYLYAADSQVYTYRSDVTNSADFDKGWNDATHFEGTNWYDSADDHRKRYVRYGTTLFTSTTTDSEDFNPPAAGGAHASRLKGRGEDLSGSGVGAGLDGNARSGDWDIGPFQTAAPTVVEHTVKPGGGGDYTTLQAWHTAQGRNLLSANEIAKANCYSGGNLNTGAAEVTLTGFTTGYANYIHIVAATGEQHQGYWDTGKAYCQSSHINYALWSNTRDMIIDGIQFRSTNTNSAGAGTPIMMYNASSSTVTRQWLLNSLAWRSRDDAAARSIQHCIKLWNNQKANSFLVQNCIGLNEDSATSNNREGISQFDSGSGHNYLYNCSIINTSTGVNGPCYNHPNCKPVLKNCMIHGGSTNTMFVGTNETIVTSYGGPNTESELTGSGSGYPFTTATYTSVTLGSVNVTPVSGSVVIDNGTDLSADTYFPFSTDAIGNARATWDLGPIELATQPQSVTLVTGSAPVFGGGMKCDGTDLADADGSTILIGAFGTTHLGQSFEGNDGYLRSVRLWLAGPSAAPPPEDIQVAVYAHSGTYGTSSVPTGSALDVNIANIDKDDITTPATNYSSYTVNFGGTLQLVYGTKYVILIGPNTSGISDYVATPTIVGGAGHPGNACAGSGVGSMTAQTYDLIFDVYTDGGVIPWEPAVGSIDSVDLLSASVFLDGEEVALENIWNTALTHLGAPTVSSTSDGSAEATLINEVWEEFFEPFLTDHSWNSAKTTAVLSTLVDAASATVTPPTRWSYAYSLPSDYLQALRVNGIAMQPNGSSLYELSTIDVDSVKTRVLFSNQTPCELEYVFDVGNQVTLLHPKTRQACSMLLAAYIAPQFGKSESEIEGYRRRAELTLADARAVDGQENSPQFFAEQPLLTARRRYGGRR